MTTYPYGYGSSTCSMADLQAKYAHLCHPEFARRGFNWIEAQGGKIGIGGGWRACPSDTSQASRECKSFHQSQTFASGLVVYSAWDLVAVQPGNVHRAPYWSEVPKQGSSDASKWGVHGNVSNEPWHLQCVEQDGFQSWVNAGRKDPNPNYSIPGGGTPVPPPVDPGWPPFVPEESEYGLYPLNTDKDEVFKAYKPQPSDLIEYLQGVLTNQCKVNAGGIDGYFGSQTESCVRQLQGWNKLEQDGRCGPKTWKCVDAYACS